MLLIDAIRSLACRAMLGLARDPTICQILSKLHISTRLLPDLIRDPILPDNINEHQQFKMYTVELVNRITGRLKEMKKDVNMTLVNEAIDPTYPKLERAAIVSNTPITYSDKELLQLVHRHLVNHGLSKTANTLLEEAALPKTLEGTENRGKKRKFQEKQTREEKERKERESNTLDQMVRQYCMDQHKRCSHPISVLPPFSLIHGHRCHYRFSFSLSPLRAQVS